MVAHKHAVQEIVLYIENDSTLYRRMYQPIVRNLAAKVVKKTYKHDLAVKGVVHLVNEGIRKYRKEFGLEGAREYGLGPGVSQATKEVAAREILRGMTEEIREVVKKMKKTKGRV